MIKHAPLELPPEIARRFFEDMRAFHRERNPIKADEIATHQLHALRQYQTPREKKLRLSDIKQLFELMMDQSCFPLVEQEKPYAGGSHRCSAR
jgi:hypothetical protein